MRFEALFVGISKKWLLPFPLLKGKSFFSTAGWCSTSGIIRLTDFDRHVLAEIKTCCFNTI